MSSVFHFGISQEDAQTERLALDIQNGDSLLSITSAGEVPLNLLALNDIKIKAVDVSANQNHLTTLKLHSIRSLEPLEAARFLGFTKTTREHRRRLYSRVSEVLDAPEKLFWDQHPAVIENGPIHAARFEKYISGFHGIALQIIGKRNLIRLFDSVSTEDRQALFDREISSFLLRKIFQVTFHPRIYKNRGIAAEGMIYTDHTKISDLFYNKFRDFCCSTPARQNYFLQLTFFNRVLFPEALPEYLTEEGVNRIRKNWQNMEICTMSVTDALRQSRKEEFNRFHLSNVGDWMSRSDFAGLLRLIHEKSPASGRISVRYIYYRHPVPEDLRESIFPDQQLGSELARYDRYPFYSLVPLIINKHPS